MIGLLSNMRYILLKKVCHLGKELPHINVFVRILAKASD